MVGMFFFHMLALCAELGVLKPSQAIGNKSGQHRACVRAFARELGARNRQGTNLDISTNTGGEPALPCTYGPSLN